MNFYSFEEIRSAGNCIAFVEQVLGLKLDHGRCAAVWRGGDGPNVAVSQTEWYDHKAKEGGGIIELCTVSRFSGNVQGAQEFLGEWLHLTPKLKRKSWSPSAPCRYDELIAEGFKEVKRYLYEDLEGHVRHFVVRMHHPEKGKEFVQGTPDGWGLRDVTPILYRLKDWVNSTHVCVVEGEKDADTVNDKLGMPATTNCGGSEKWRPEYAEFFHDKNVAILRDNDEAGGRHAVRVARELKDVARRIVIVNPSKLPKGDVTDWLEQEGGSREALVELIKTAPPVDLTTLEPIDPAIEAAKVSNRTDFANFTEEKEQIGPVVKIVKRPRQITDLIEDTHKRFLGFPRRVGGSQSLFDHDRDTGRIVHLHAPTDLFAWIGCKSRRKVAWAIGDAMVTKGEFFKGLLASAQTYEAISNVPDWPKRGDVYYAHPPLPKASPGFQYFHDFVGFFNPATETYRTLLKAFVCAPLWYIRGIPRPGWIIDSVDGAGAGKTTLIELVSRLYLSSPIRTNKQELKTDVSEIIKRLVSTEGRLARILLADNITGEFHCAELSDFMTAETISGKAPYGRGEETRPNNLTYVITANSATVDNDLSDRCFFVHLSRPERTGNWKREVLEFLEKHRFNVLADIIGLLEYRQGQRLEVLPQTRFPEFEETILQSVCADENEYASAIATLAEAKASSNSDDELARIVAEEFASRLVDIGRRPASEQIWIQSSVAKLWVDEILERGFDGNAIQFLRNLAKNGLARCFDAKIEQYPHRGPSRHRGIMWVPENPDGGAVRIIGLKGRRVGEIV
jgi:5S rRNA maturation endonuclease (ribonuclease M5)